jgi:hypothetical protein
MAGDVSKHLERAKRFLEKNRVEDAIEAYLAVLDEAPQHQEATQALGDLYARMDQPDVAHIFGFRDPVTTGVAAWCRIARVPYVFEPLGMFEPRLRKVFLKRALDATLYRGVARGAAADRGCRCRRALSRLPVRGCSRSRPAIFRMAARSCAASATGTPSRPDPRGAERRPLPGRRTPAGLLPQHHPRAGGEGTLDQVRLKHGFYQAFVELHIEQGPLLEQAGVPIGVVKAIAAPGAFRKVQVGRPSGQVLADHP